VRLINYTWCTCQATVDLLTRQTRCAVRCIVVTSMQSRALPNISPELAGSMMREISGYNVQVSVPSSRCQSVASSEINTRLLAERSIAYQPAGRRTACIVPRHTIFRRFYQAAVTLTPRLKYGLGTDRHILMQAESVFEHKISQRRNLPGTKSVRSLLVALQALWRRHTKIGGFNYSLLWEIRC